MAGISVEKRGTKWRYRFDTATVDGKRVQKSKGGFDSKREALAAGTRALNEYNTSGEVFVPSEISYSDYLDKWYNEYCIPNMKRETLAQYEKIIRLHIKPTLGHYKLKVLTFTAMQNLLNKKFNDGFSRNTLPVIKGILTSSMSYAVEPLRYIVSDPAVSLKLPSYRAEPKTPTRSEPHVYIPPERMQAILKRFPEGTTAHIPLQIGYRCGLRIGETFGLTWDDIDFEDKTLSVNRQILWDKFKSVWYVTAPKYNSYRTIELDDALLELLRRAKAKQEKAKAYHDGDYIRNYVDANNNVNVDGDGTEQFFLNVRENGELVKSRIIQHTSSIIHHNMKYPEFDYHSLRHTHATMLAEADAPPKYVQERLGHKGIDVTMKIYQHLTKKMSERGTVALNDIYH